MELHELLERVKDQETFMVFARALAEDRALAAKAEVGNPAQAYGPDAGGWENRSIEQFLEAAVAWAEGSNFGARQGLDSASPWQKFASFLYCGKIYE